VKGIIVYFSQTGNTKKIAQAVQRGMERVLDQCDMAKLIKGLEVNPYDLRKYDVIGLGSAIIWGPPENVRTFIDSMPPSLKGKHIFAFTTHGTYPHDFLPRVARLLTRKGLVVIGTNDWFGSAILPSFPKPYFTDGHPDDVDLKEAEDFGREMAERSRRIYAGETELIPPLPELFRPLPKWPPILTGKSGEQFKYHKEKCNYPKCTLCIDNCPWDAIDLSAPQPYICRNGGVCTWCEKICPTGAIEFNYESRVPEHREMIKTLLIPSLEAMEASGRFRRLVPKDKIGWDTPYFKVHDKHPREKVLKD